MTHLTDEHLQQLLHATNEARARRSALPVGNLHRLTSRRTCIA